MNPGHLGKCQAPILHQFGQATTPRRLVLGYDASNRPLHTPRHSDLLAGMIPLESGRTRFSSRFSRLRVGLTTGEDAFPRSQGVGNWLTAVPNIETQVIKDHSLSIIPR